jgi:flavodoxin
MKTEIYYFSGTGNSLNVAQKISKKIEQIGKIVNGKEEY